MHRPRLGVDCACTTYNYACNAPTALNLAFGLFNEATKNKDATLLSVLFIYYLFICLFI